MRHEKTCECSNCQRDRHESAVDAVMSEFGHLFGEPKSWVNESAQMKAALEVVHNGLLLLQLVGP